MAKQLLFFWRFGATQIDLTKDDDIYMLSQDSHIMIRPNITFSRDFTNSNL